MKNVYVNKDWGFEKWIENNELYCGKEINVFKDLWSSNGRYHFHKIKDETFYVISGKLKLMIVENDNEVEYIMESGDSKRIRPGTLHKFTSITECCIFMEFSTTHNENDSYRVDDNMVQTYMEIIDCLLSVLLEEKSKPKKYKKTKLAKIKIGDMVERKSDGYRFIVGKCNCAMCNRLRNEFIKI